MDDAFKAKIEEQIKTIFNRLNKIETQLGNSNDDAKREVASLKAEVDLLEKTIAMNNADMIKLINNMSDDLKGEINSIMNGNLEDKLKNAEEKNEKYFKWVFWLITAVLGVFISTVVLSFLNSR